MSRKPRAFAITAGLVVITAAPLSAQYQWTLVVGNGAKPANYSAQTIERFSFVCQPNLPIQSVYGTDTYTDDTNICSAAVHAGVITREEGGAVTLVIKDGHTTYVGSTRNGVTSEKYYKDYNRGYSFVSGGGGILDWRTTAGQIPSAFMTSVDLVCPPGSEVDVAKNPIYGTGVYKDDSSICAAAVHAGSITTAGGEIRLVPRGPQTSFTATTRNGVKSLVYGTYTGSFSVSKPFELSQSASAIGASDASMAIYNPLPLGTTSPPFRMPRYLPVVDSLDNLADSLDNIYARLLNSSNTIGVDTLDNLVGRIGALSDQLKALGGNSAGNVALTRFGESRDFINYAAAAIAYPRIAKLSIVSTPPAAGNYQLSLAATDSRGMKLPLTNIIARTPLAIQWKSSDPKCAPADNSSTSGATIRTNSTCAGTITASIRRPANLQTGATAHTATFVIK